MAQAATHAPIALPDYPRLPGGVHPLEDHYQIKLLKTTMDRLVREATGTVPYGVEHVIRTAESLERTTEIRDLPGRLGHGYLTSDYASRHGGLTSGERRLDFEYELCLLGHTSPTSNTELPIGPDAKGAKHTATGSVVLPLAVAVARLASVPVRMIDAESLVPPASVMTAGQTDSQRAGWGWSLIASSEESEAYASFLSALLRYNRAKIARVALGFVAMSYADLEHYGATHSPGESPLGVDRALAAPHPAWFSRLGDDERVRKTVAFLVDLLEVLPSRMWNDSAQKFEEGPKISLAALYDAYAQAQVELGVDERFRVPLRKDLTVEQIDPRYFEETDVASDEFIEGKDLRVFCWRHRCRQRMFLFEDYWAGDTFHDPWQQVPRGALCTVLPKLCPHCKKTLTPDSVTAISTIGERVAVTSAYTQKLNLRSP